MKSREVGGGPYYASTPPLHIYVIWIVLHEVVEQLLQISLVVVARRDGRGDVEEWSQDATDE